MISHKFWDTVTLFFILLLSIILITSLTQVIIGGTLLKGISTLTFKVLNIVFAVSIFLIIIVLVLENDNPIKTMAWILILLYLPIIGFVFYLFFGRNWRKTRIFNRKGMEDIENLEVMKISSAQKAEILKKIEYPLARKMISLLESNSKALLTDNNDISIIPDTSDALEEIIRGISAAQRYIHMEFFSISADETGQRFKQALIEKAKAGVTIRIIYDAVGCWNLSHAYKSELRKAGIELQPFLRSWIPFFSSKLNYRNHRKIVIIDGRIGYLGGLNIGNKYLHLIKYFGYWRDTLVTLEGKSVISLHAIFLTDWFFVCRQDLLRRESYLVADDSRHPLKLKEIFKPRQDRMAFAENIPVQIVSSGPDSHHESIMQVYFAAIADARKCVHITSPYLILNDSLLMALKTASLSGVEVKIILPRKADHFIVFWGSRSYYEELLAAGVSIYEYQKGFIHAKVLIVDGEITSIGTANMDLRSFNHNFEINAMFYGKDAAKIAEAQFQDDLNCSRQIILSEFRKRSIVHKTVESVCRLFSPLL